MLLSCGYSVCPFLFFSQIAPIPSGLWVVLEGCCDVWSLSSVLSTGLVLMCDHAYSYANRMYPTQSIGNVTDCDAHNNNTLFSVFLLEKFGPST